MQRSKLNWLSSIAAGTSLLPSLLLLSGCTQSVRLYDDENCVDAGKFGGRCERILSHQKRVIPKEIWEGFGPEARFGRGCFTPEAFGHIKKSLLELCNVSKACTTEDIAQIQKIDAQIQKLSRQLEPWREPFAAEARAQAEVLAAAQVKQ